jgi:hypothetical protein
MTKRNLYVAFGATLAALLALVGYVLSQAFPSSEAVRLRNALLMASADARVGEWSPDKPPSTFLKESMAVPAPIVASARKVLEAPLDSDVDKARALASHLLVNVRDTGPVQSLEIEKTYRAIVEEGRGYCADIIRAYMALALAGGLPVRSWAFSFDGFGGHGHIVAEIYDRGAQQWVMLDVFNNVMPVSADAAAPMSARDFIAAFRAREADIKFVPIGPGRAGFVYDEKLRDYYRRGVDAWYLWDGNNVVSRGRGHAIVGWLGAVAEPLGELASIALGDFPRIVPLATATNGVYIERMHSLRARLLWITALGVILGAALIAEVVALANIRRRTQSRR